MEPLHNEPRTIGRYSLLSRIAYGGMGEIHLARLTSMQGVERYFAIKLLLPQFTEEASVVDMFVTEARITARIQHPNVCQVYELGTENDELFICMEFLQGVSVSAILKSHTPSSPIPVGITGAIIEQACAGLQFAHDLLDDKGNSLGVVHRDVSPGNLFLTSSGMTKVLDFGIVKANDKAVKTQTGVLKGKMGYMSPEQIMGKTVDHRSDIFSLGTVLFELLTNQRLFSRESEFYTLKAILEEPPTKLRQRRPDLSLELEEVVSRALSQNVDERFSSMKEFGHALKLAMVNHGGFATTSEIASFVQQKYATSLAEIEELLRYAKVPTVVSPDEETMVAKSLQSRDEPNAQPINDEEVSRTAPVTRYAGESSLMSKPALWALVLIGVSILSLAAVIFLKKDKEASAPQAIVFEGQVTRENASAIPPPQSVDAGMRVVNNAEDASTRPSRSSRCEDKPSAKARNSCKVSRKGQELQRCLRAHVVDVTNTPRLTLNFFLNSRGKILSVDVTPTSIGNSSLGKCVKEVASTIRFGGQGGNVKFSVPLRINQ